MKKRMISINHNTRLNKAFSLLIAFILMFGFTSCSGSSGPEATNEKLSDEQAVEALVQVIREAGIDFPSLNEPSSKVKTDVTLLGWDYLDVETNSSGVIEIQLWLDAEGHIIPKPEWQEANPNVCSEQGRYMRSAAKLLEFSIFPASKETQLNLIDIETGKIGKSVWGSPSTEDPDWLMNAIKEAWDKMQEQAVIKDITGACGEMMEKATATITYSGGTISFSADNITVITAQANKLGIGLLDLDTGLYIYLLAYGAEEINEGGYNMQINYNSDRYSYATLEQMSGSDLMTEQYDTRDIFEHNLTGNGQLIITSLTNNQVEGTFSATLYSASGKKAKITDGEFKIIGIDFEF